MKLYSTTGAPNPRRVRIFLAEKNIDVPIQELSIMEAEQYFSADSFTARSHC